jgi:hypothetical protein
VLIVFLYRVDGFPEFLMKLFKVSDEFLSTYGGKVALQVDCDVWIVALVGK